MVVLLYDNLGGSITISRHNCSDFSGDGVFEFGFIFLYVASSVKRIMMSPGRPHYHVWVGRAKTSDALLDTSSPAWSYCNAIKHGGHVDHYNDHDHDDNG